MTPYVRAALVAAAFASGPALAGCSTVDPEPVPDRSSSAGSSGIHVVECVPGNLVQQPAQLPTACADANEVLEELDWSGWGEPTATATGSLVSNDCDPSCVDGEVSRYPVEVELSHIQRGEALGVYRRMTVTPTEDAPQWWDGPEVFRLPGISG